MKLYEVKSVIPRYEKPNGRRFANVPVHWFRWFDDDEPATEPPRPYAELIAGFDTDHPDEIDVSFIDELFTKEEAEQLADFLKTCPDCGGERKNWKITISEVDLPVKKGDCYPYQWMPCRPNHIDFLCPFIGPDYSLPFKAAGYFDVERGLEALEGGLLN
jgi:hypothetical protein